MVGFFFCCPAPAQPDASSLFFRFLQIFLYKSEKICYTVHKVQKHLKQVFYDPLRNRHFPKWRFFCALPRTRRGGRPLSARAPLPLPLGEVAERSEDGEGKPARGLQSPLSQLR